MYTEPEMAKNTKCVVKIYLACFYFQSCIRFQSSNYMVNSTFSNILYKNVFDFVEKCDVA